MAGGLASAAVLGFGATRVSAAARPSTAGVTTTPLRSPDGCDAVSYVTGVSTQGTIVGSGPAAGMAFGPVLWQGGRISTPLAPGGARPLEISGISDFGQYAGTYDDPATGRRTALLWTNGVPQPIRIGSLHTRAAFMDRYGRVLVQARAAWPVNGEGWTYDRMFLYEQGRATPVRPPGGGPWDSVQALGLNNRGAVLAAAVAPGTASTEAQPFLWQAGRTTWLTDIGGSGSVVRASALNDLGQVAGTVTWNDGSFQRRAFRWQAGRHELSPLPAGVTSGEVWAGGGQQAINLRGDVVAVVYDNDDASVGGKPALWSGDTVTVLPVPDDAVLALAEAVNDRRDVCGFYEPASIGYFRPCLWRDGQRIDLPVPEGLLSTKATRLDNDGHVYSSAGPSTAGTTSGGWTSGGTSGGGTSVSGGSVSSGGTTTSGGSVSSGGSVASGGTTTSGGSAGSGTTGGSGCSASWYNSVLWTVTS
jgi:hypothetical protein